MPLVDVPCKLNVTSIDVTANHIDGKPLSFTIEPGQALIDSDNYIRFFVLDWGDGKEQGYLLHPYHKRTNAVIEGLSWTAGFLGSYGLSKQRGQLVKKLPQDTHPGLVQIVDLLAYFTFSTVGSKIVVTIQPLLCFPLLR